MSSCAMGHCEQHPQFDVPGEGVCPGCLQKKLNYVWRGESYSDVAAAEEVSTSMPMYQTSSVDPILPKEAVAVLGSIASIAKLQLSEQSTRRAGDTTELASMESMAVLESRCDNTKPSRLPHPSFDVRDGIFTKRDTPTDAKRPPRKQPQDIEGVMRDWTELHAKRRSQGKKDSVTIATESPMVEYSRAGLPLVDRIAKETALRVIREVGDDLSIEEFQEELHSGNCQPGDEIWEVDKLVESLKQQEKSTFLSPVQWHSKIRSKWVKRLGSPLTNSNKVFPSKPVENVQKPHAQSSPARTDSRLKNPRVKKPVEGRKALSFNLEPTIIPYAKVLYDSELNPETVIEGMPDQILKPEDMNQRLKMSYDTVLSWLQDLPVPQSPLFQQTGEPEDPSLPSSPVVESRSNDLYDEDLTLVGHLHEIAEVHEDFEESSEEEVSTTNHLSEVSSFGKFLIRAAQRQPREGLSRVASGSSAR